MVKVVKGLPTEWGVCSRTVILDSHIEALSYHNNSIAVGSGSWDIIILDTITGTQTAVLSGHTNIVNSVEFSSDGTSLVSASFDETIKLWDVQTGGIVKTFSDAYLVVSVSISADCTTLASGSEDFTTCLWNIKTGECYHKIKQEDTVDCVIFSPTDPQHLISISGDQVWQWDSNGHKIKPPFYGQHVCFSSDGVQFVSCYKKAITVYNSSSGAIVAEFQITSSNAYQCSFSPDGRLIAVAADRTIYCWNITNSKPHLIETFIGHTEDITSLVFSSDTTLISASKDKSIKFWQIGVQSADPAGIDPKFTPPPSVPIMSITLQANDGFVITSDSDGVVKTWDISTGIHKASFQTPAQDHMRDVQMIKNRLILVWYADREVHVWDVGNEKLLLEVEIRGNVKGLRISEDGSMFFCLGVFSVQAWSIQKGKVVGEVKTESGGWGSLTIDGWKVWVHWPESEEYEGWDFETSGSALTELSGMPTLSNGSMIWDPRRGMIKNAVSGGVIFQLSGRFASPADVQCDGSYLVAGYVSGEILVLELKHLPL